MPLSTICVRSAVPVCFLLSLACLAAQDSTDKQIGVWKLNIERSQLPPSPNPIASSTQSVEKVGPKSYRESFDIVFKDGQKRHADTVRTYDGQEHKREGQSGSTETCEILDPNTIKCTTKRNGQVASEVTATILPGGKTMTARSRTIGSDGKQTMSVRVYEKQ